MLSLIPAVLPIHNGSLALNESVQSVLSLSHPVWIFLQRLFLSLFPEPPESSGLISPVTTYSGVYDSHACMLSRVQIFVTLWTVPTRVLHPWNSPGQNTGSVKWKSVSHVWLFATPWTMYTVHGILQARILQVWSESRSVMSDSLRPHGLYIQSMGFSRPEY